MAAKPTPVLAAPRLIAKAVPAARSVAKTAAPAEPARAVAKAPVVPAPQAVVAAAPVRLVARVEPAPRVAASGFIPKALPAAPAVHATPVPAKVAAVPAAPAVQAAPAPAVVVKAEPVVRKPSNFHGDDWLVTLPPEESKAAPVTKAPPKAAAVKPGAYAKADYSGQLKEYEAYVKMKSRDPYSNLE